MCRPPWSWTEMKFRFLGDKRRTILEIVDYCTKNMQLNYTFLKSQKQGCPDRTTISILYLSPLWTNLIGKEDTACSRSWTVPGQSAESWPVTASLSTPYWYLIKNIFSVNIWNNDSKLKHLWKLLKASRRKYLRVFYRNRMQLLNLFSFFLHFNIVYIDPK